VKYSVITFGCRVNQADSLGFEEELRAAGAESVASPAADVVIVNTCSVTATSDQGARQTIRRIARDNPSARIVVTGCYATRRPDEVAALPNVVQVISNDDKPRLLSVLNRQSAESAERAEKDVFSATVARLWGCFAEWRRPMRRDARTGHRRAGPRLRCAFRPAVPSPARTASFHRLAAGREASGSGSVARSRASRRLGFKEIALTGVHLGSFGRDLDPPGSLIQLLQDLDSWSAKASAERVLFRISSLEPMDCSREIVDLVANSPSFAPHFHLPLQHASNRVLSRCGGLTRSSTTRPRRRYPHSASRTRRLDPTSSSVSRRDGDDFERLGVVSRDVRPDAPSRLSRIPIDRDAA
jgi:threonylcarbamoyladenosine tRNA methylthiotransferase MtaB